MTAHTIPLSSEQFGSVLNGERPYVIGPNNRPFRDGDILSLQEMNPATGAFTGRSCERKITHVLTGPVFGLAAGWVILSFGRKSTDMARRKDHR